jgi:hypothetical protein
MNRGAKVRFELTTNLPTLKDREAAEKWSGLCHGISPLRSFHLLAPLFGQEGSELWILHHLV